MGRTRGPKLTEPRPRPALIKSREAVHTDLLEQLKRGVEIRDAGVSSWEDLKGVRERWYTWRDYVEELLRAVFTTDEPSKEFAASTRFVYSLGGPPDLREDIDEFRSDIGTHVRRLESIIQRLPLYDAPADSSTSAGSPKTRTNPASSRRVFIVHGRDRGPVDAAARLLRDQGLEAVILDEQPNRGRTIIEKFEQHTDVAYAVAILSPDDEGGLAGGSMRPRARQNVILELGFFVGKLGRHRVAALVDQTVEIPSDIDGVVFIPLDEGRQWRFRLAQEMRDAALDIDLNGSFAHKKTPNGGSLASAVSKNRI